MKPGSVVIVENFVFLDGQKDVDGYERKCIVLYEETRDDEEYLCLCPVVEQRKSAFKKVNEYSLLPLSSKNGEKMFWAKLSSLVFKPKTEIIRQDDLLEPNITKRLIEKIKENYINYSFSEYYSNFMNKIEENIPVK